MPKTKRAILKCSGEVLGDLVPILADGGIVVVGSVNSVVGHETVCLVIQGDALPDECDAYYPLKCVTAYTKAETYGKQRINKVSGWEISEAIFQPDTDRIWRVDRGAPVHDRRLERASA